jgi:hypothetical protein
VIVKGSAMRLKAYLNSKLDVFSLINPGAGIGNIVDSSIRGLINLTKNYVTVFNSGSNDMKKVKMNVALSEIT